ncbi:MAG: hypothetical protein AAF658_18370, partial [Myxococcota bacterium]
RAKGFLIASESLYLAALTELGLPIPITLEQLLAALDSVPAPVAPDGWPRFEGPQGENASDILLSRISEHESFWNHAENPGAHARRVRLTALILHRLDAALARFELAWLDNTPSSATQLYGELAAHPLHLESGVDEFVALIGEWGRGSMHFRAARRATVLDQSLVEAHGETWWSTRDVLERLESQGSVWVLAPEHDGDYLSAKRWLLRVAQTLAQP